MKKTKGAKKEDIDKSRQEQECANEKMFGEVRALKDKLQKLATTFDRELLERDKALKKYQNGLWDEIQMMLKSVHEDAEITTKLCQNLVT